MEPSEYPFSLRERLGPHGATALADVLAVQRTDIVTLVMDTFDHRLIEECGRLRTDLRAELRTAANELRSDLRADFRVEVANVRADLLKWSFLFWAGQIAAVLGLVSLLR